MALLISPNNLSVHYYITYTNSVIEHIFIIAYFVIVLITQRIYYNNLLQAKEEEIHHLQQANKNS